MTDLSVLSPTFRRANFKLTSALGILCLQLAACSSTNEPPGGSAGTSGGGAGGSPPIVAGSTAASGTPTFGGTPGNPSGGTGGTTASAGTGASGGTLLLGGSGGQSGGASAGRGGNATAGSSAGAGAGGKGGSGGAGGASGGSTAAGGAGAGGTAGAAGRGGSAGAPTAGTGTGGGGTYNPCPTNGDPCKIVPMGDSITVGIGTGTTGGGYRIELFKKATADGKKITFDGVAMSSCNISTPQNPPSGFVNTHSACSGWTIQQIAGMVAGSVQKKPDIILLMAGTNDARNAQDAPARLGMLLDQIFTADSHVLVVVAKLTPFPGGQAGVDQINAAIPNLVQERAAAGKHIMMVDMSTGYPSNSLPDGVHPNQAGYVFMADVWYKAIGPLLP